MRKDETNVLFNTCLHPCDDRMLVFLYTERNQVLKDGLSENIYYKYTQCTIKAKDKV